MKITSINIYRFSIPMIPFTIATGTMDFAQNIYLEVTTANGIKGVGECSAFPMIVGETQDTDYVLAQELARLWIGRDPFEIQLRMRELNTCIAGNFTIKSAFDMALHDIVSKESGMPLFKYLGGAYFEPESDLTIGIGSVADMRRKAKDYVENRGVKILKIKLGKDIDLDILRVQAVREVAGKKVVIRIDANQGYDLADAKKLLKNIEQHEIQFCEQPMHRRNDKFLPDLMSSTSIPIMADESVFDHYDAQRIIENDATHLVNIKLAKSGGILEALKIHEVCSRNNIANMLGGMLESRVALTANVHLALASPNIKYYDFDSCLIGHKLDPVVNGVQYNGMHLQVPEIPGIGAEAHPHFLSQCEMTQVR